MIRQENYKQITKRIVVICFVIMALALQGAVPSFALSVSDIIHKQEEPDYVREHAVVSYCDVDYNKGPETYGTSVVMIDGGSGQTLYEKNPYELREPASITKIVTCMVALERLAKNRVVTVDFQPTTEGSVMGLKRGEKISVQNLLYGLMLCSGNDAAEVLAVEISGDMESFSKLMNDKASWCGAKNTKFFNPNGLNGEGEKNITTAYDIALIARKAMENPQFRELVATRKVEVPATNKSKKRKIVNTNRCISDRKPVYFEGEEVLLKYDSCTGVKTGYTSSAGDCFAGAARRGNTELITVVLNAPHEEEKFIDSARLWDYGFSNFKTETIAKAGDVQYRLRVKGGKLREVDLALEDDLEITANRDDGRDVKKEITLKVETIEKEIQAPVKKGEELGQLVALNTMGEVVATGKLLSTEDCSLGGPLSAVGIADEDIPIVSFVLSLLVISIALIILLCRRKFERKENI